MSHDLLKLAIEASERRNNIANAIAAKVIFSEEVPESLKEEYRKATTEQIRAWAVFELSKVK